MKPELLFEDSVSQDKLLGNLQVFQEQLQKVVDEFQSLKLDIKIDQNFLHSLITAPDETIRGIFKGRIADVDPVTGLNVNKNAVLATMQLPDIKALRERCNSVNNYLRNGSDWFYQFDITDGQIELNEKRIEQLLDKHRIYGRNQDELDLFYVLQLIGEKLDHVNKLTRFLQRDHRGRISFDIGTLFEYKGEKLVMRMDGFSSLLKKL